RYDSAQELLADVQRWIADEPISAYRESAPMRLARWARRHRAAVQTAAALLLVTTGLVVIGKVTSELRLDRLEKQTDPIVERADAALRNHRPDEASNLLTDALARMTPERRFDRLRTRAERLLAESKLRIEHDRRERADRARFAEFLKAEEESLFLRTEF